jgi:hypothetical protein
MPTVPDRRPGSSGSASRGDKDGPARRNKYIDTRLYILWLENDSGQVWFLERLAD